MKLDYLLVPLITVFVALAGNFFTSAGLSGWYDTIKKPSWTPPGFVIGAVWTTIFILTAAAALVVLNAPGPRSRIVIITSLFLLNAALNIVWSLLFFRLHLIDWAVWEAAALGASVVAIIVLAWPVSRLASFLLMPYAAWVAFATFLTAIIWKINR